MVSKSNTIQISIEMRLVWLLRSHKWDVNENNSLGNSKSPIFNRNTKEVIKIC